MHDRRYGGMVAASDMLNAAVGPYFDTLLADGYVIASDARRHPTTRIFLDDYKVPQDINSLLDVCFSVKGVLFGTFSCEQLGMPVDWTQRQLQALRKIVSRASLTLMHVVNASIDTAPGALWETSTPNRLATMPMPLDLPPDLKPE